MAFRIVCARIGGDVLQHQMSYRFAGQQQGRAGPCRSGAHKSMIRAIQVFGRAVYRLPSSGGWVGTRGADSRTESCSWCFRCQDDSSSAKTPAIFGGRILPESCRQCRRLKRRILARRDVNVAASEIRGSLPERREAKNRPGGFPARHHRAISSRPWHCFSVVGENHVLFTRPAHYFPGPFCSAISSSSVIGFCLVQSGFHRVG